MERQPDRVALVEANKVLREITPDLQAAGIAIPDIGESEEGQALFRQWALDVLDGLASGKTLAL